MPGRDELGAFFDPKTLVTVFCWIGVLAAIFLLMVSVKKGIDYLQTKDPVEALRKDMNESLEDHQKQIDIVNTKLHTDNERFKDVDVRFRMIESKLDKTSEMQKEIAKRSEENFKQLGKSMIAILEHLRTGNGIDGLKATQTELTNYFIDGVDKKNGS